jgi:hypothetical protein
MDVAAFERDQGRAGIDHGADRGIMALAKSRYPKEMAEGVMGHWGQTRGGFISDLSFIVTSFEVWLTYAARRAQEMTHRNYNRNRCRSCHRNGQILMVPAADVPGPPEKISPRPRWHR